MVCQAGVGLGIHAGRFSVPKCDADKQLTGFNWQNLQLVYLAEAVFDVWLFMDYSAPRTMARHGD